MYLPLWALKIIYVNNGISFTLKYEILSFAAKWMELEDIIINEIL